MKKGKYIMYCFISDIIRVKTGERIWWYWRDLAKNDLNRNIMLFEENKVITSLPESSAHNEANSKLFIDSLFKK